jgi:SAM-dependent methyltransferase
MIGRAQQAAALPHLRDLRSDEFLHQRIAPATSDYYYLHLSDLLLALRAHASHAALRILDFGAGGSPYKSLFPASDYRTADLQGSQADFDIDEDGHTDAPDSAFDLVLSTQVLEHCRNPDRYLSEALRVLKADGKLILSTHGLFEEHACPYDFFRWTADGLRTVVEHNGFAVESLVRVTAGPRAAFHLMQSALSQGLLDGKRLLSRLLWRPVLRFLLARRFWNALLDRTFAEYRVVTRDELPFANTCIGLLVVAKPRCRGESVIKQTGREAQSLPLA